MSNTNPNSTNILSERSSRNALYAIGILLIAVFAAISLFVYIGAVDNQPGLFIVAGALLIMAIIDFGCITLVRRGQTDSAMGIVLLTFLIVVAVAVAFIEGIGLIAATATLFFMIGISALALTNRYATWGILASVGAAIGMYILDYFLPANRINIPELIQYSSYIVYLLVFGFILLGIREFNYLSIRIKIALGILVTGGITVASLSAFGLVNAVRIVDYINGKYTASVQTNIEQNITAQLVNEAAALDSTFTKTLTDLSSLADFKSQLSSQSDLFGEGIYWNAEEDIIEIPSGARKNSSGPASIFIPSFVTMDETVIKDLNESAYLDFYAPDFLKRNPEVIAVYFVQSNGISNYYPDIDLANNVPGDFDPRREVFYTVAAPESNPAREPKRTPVYLDPAGQGLILTFSIPVYDHDDFTGVMSADINVSALSDQITKSTLAQNGNLILTDQAGHILVMPETAYSIFGLQTGSNNSVDFFQESLLTKGSFDLQTTVSRAVNGETASQIITINDTPYLAAFAPLETSNFRMIFLSPLSNFNTDLKEAESEVNTLVRSSLQNIFTLLTVLFIGAVLVSIAMGQIITRPLVKLASVASQIAEGNFNVHASSDTADESGTLAESFNIMTERIKSLLSGLEERVNERTKEIESINQKNLRRASLFEAITRISRAISQSQSLNVLLPQIVENIAIQFNIYHAGIFLLDVNREFALLAAANSEGGQRMLARGHRLQVGETGIVGFATKTGQARIALDVGSDAAFFNNPDLPNTHSEIALPLIAGGEIIGALDVQSEEANAFNDEDINILSTLADQVAVAIQNARSYQQTQEALAKAEAISYDLSRKAWLDFQKRESLNGFYFDGSDTQVLPKGSQTPDRSIAIPLVLRGAQIGTLRLSPTSSSRNWTDDEIALAQAAADRTALALENARLLEEAQRRAAKERTIGEITSKIGGLVNLDSIVQTTIQELGNTLPDTDIAVQFTKE